MNATASRHEPLRVVVIDDTADLRLLLGLALASGGMVVVGEAGDGEAGIEVVRGTRPDLVLLDLSMPVMDGLEALPAIRRLIPDSKIVVLSGFGAAQMSDRALRLGADGYLQKGMPIRRMMDYLRGVTAGDDQPRSPGAGEPAPPPLSLVPSVKTSSPPDDTSSNEMAATSPTAQPRSLTLASGGTDASARQAVALAPFGVLEVADHEDLAVMHANPAAQRLLNGQAWPGVLLSELSSELVRLVSEGRFDDGPGAVEVGGVALDASVRRGHRSLMIFLSEPAQETAGLRRAIATTAHEIRGPVTVLCGVAETILETGDALDDARRAHLMSSVVRQARSLDYITQDLLTASQRHRESLHLDLVEVQPEAVIETVINDRGLNDVTVRIDDRRPVRADPMRMEQMVGNLLSNAAKYGRGPFFTVVRRHAVDPGMVCVDIADSGDGVPEEFQEQLFQEFSRSPGAVVPGNGLGLYVVKSLAEAQGGSVEYSRALTGGAMFTIVLPARDLRS